MKILSITVATYALLGCTPHALSKPAPPITQAADDGRDGRNEAFATHGLALLDRGDYVRAEQYLQLALQTGHPEAPLIIPLLRSCIASNRIRTALGHAEHYLDRHPDAWHVRYVKAAILRALDQPALAKQELERVLAEAPTALSAEDRTWLVNGGRT